MPLSPLSYCLMIIILLLTVGWTVTYIDLKENKIPLKPKEEVLKTFFGKRVAKIDKLTGEILQTYLSVKDAARDTKGASFSHISAVCNKKRKTAYGFRWEFI